MAPILVNLVVVSNVVYDTSCILSLQLEQFFQCEIYVYMNIELLGFQRSQNSGDM